jgi:hypothetical protein
MPFGDPGFLLAGPARFRPRPTFMAYTAYTPWLARRNQEWLESDKGPDAVVFRPCAIDGKHPTVIDNLSFLTLATHYRVVRNHWPYAVLERRPRPRTYRLVPLGSVAATQGEPVAVPDAAGGPIWAVIGIQPSPAGWLTTALFKARPLRIRSTMDERKAVHRLPARMASTGFLLSPYLGQEGFYRYYTAKPAITEESWWVRSVVVDTPPLPKLPLPEPYSRDFTIEFFRVQLEEDS